MQALGAAVLICCMCQLHLSLSPVEVRAWRWPSLQVLQTQKKVTKHSSKKSSNILKPWPGSSWWSQSLYGWWVKGAVSVEYFSCQLVARGAWMGTSPRSNAWWYVVFCGSLLFRGVCCLLGQAVFPLLELLQHSLKSYLCLDGEAAALHLRDLSYLLRYRILIPFAWVFSWGYVKEETFREGKSYYLL